ncbi:hypothetical protein [Microbacterium lushaniae]|uniref:Uncharacterized protein n=1 Tax=Microbacterium lushaniae TaxID=2614639 RepID=A0A5J6L355_9MICO|nr:hypothetical protein [Microbacterium lushaniae]QEW03023.1 hypothetical protein F6J85_07855 [Microbacterium lushaniae]
MSNDDDLRGRTRAERSAGRRYVGEFTIGVAAYLLLFLVLPRLVVTEPGSAWSVVIALTPIAPVLWMVIAMARHVRRVDELQRALLLHSFTVGFGAAMLIALAIALVTGAGIDTRHSEWAVFIGGMAAWGVSLGAFSFRANR